MSTEGLECEPAISIAIHELLSELLTGGRVAKAFDAVEALIKERYMEKITIDEMAAARCMSKYHFIRAFKAGTGFSPYEYLTKYRLNVAKKLLITSDLTVDEIARRCGFDSVSNFICKFKAAVGATPGGYRKDRI